MKPWISFPFAGTALLIVAGSLLSLACQGSPSPGKEARNGEPVSESTRLQAISLLREGQPRRALSLLEGLFASKNPDDAFLVGEAALRSGQYARAQQAYRQVLRFRPDDLLASSRLARIAYMEARYDEAQEQLNWILARSPDHLDARELRCRIRLRQGNLEGAAADARRWAQLAPEESEPLRFLGTVQRRQGDTDRARRSLESALERDPDDIAAWLELSRIFAETGQPPQAEEAIAEVKRLTRQRREKDARRSEASYYRLRALERREAGDPATALEHLRAALSKNPDDPDLLREAGEAALDAALAWEAKEFLDRAVILAPRNALIRRVRGEVSLAQQEPARALDDLLEASRLDPSDPTIHRTLARAYRALDNLTEAEREEAVAANLEQESVPRTQLEVIP